MRRAMLAVALGTIACSSDHVGTGPVATRLVFSGQPSAATAGVVITPAIQVTALDDGGAVVTSFSGTITIALAANPGSATLSGTLTRGAIGGVATFSDLRLNRTGSGYAFVASSGSLTTATSGSFVIAPAPPVQLAFAVQPTDVVAGVAMTPAVQVQARDSLGNVSPSFTGSVTLVLAPNGAGAVLGGTTSVSAVAGLASFTGLRVDTSGSAYTIQAAAGALTTATSAAFNVSPAAATRLAFTVEPSAVVAGTAFAPAVAVAARDTFGNLATTFTGTVVVSIAVNPAGGNLSGSTSLAAVGGVATFSTLSIDKAGSGYRLLAAAGSLTKDTSSAFDVTVGGAVKLAFVQQPTATTGGATIAPAVTVEVEDGSGNRVTGATNSITLTIGTNPNNGSLIGTKTAIASAGLASFGNLAIDSAGAGYTLTASAAGLTAATSNSFTVAVGTATQLGFRVQPSGTTGGVAIAPAVQVEIRDAGGNRVTGATNQVTVALGNNPKNGHLVGSTVVGATAGAASFSTLAIDSAAAGYTLVASAGGLTAATSAAFTVAVGTATKLGFLVGPSTGAAGASIAPPLQVEVRDAGGNRVTTATNTVGTAIGFNPAGGTLSGTTSAAATNGVATFSNLSIDKAGVGYTLQATATGLTAVVSSPFTITSGAADHLAFFVQPTDDSAGVAISPAVQVEILDAAGNRVTNDTRGITLAILDNPSGGTLSGPATVVAVSGVSTFSSLNIDKAGTGYTLQATSSPALTPAVSTDFDIIPARPSRLHFFVEPSNVTAGASITPAVQVEVLDAFANRVGTATPSVAVALLANPGGGTLSGTKSQTASAGVATFSNLSINKTGAGYTLRATATGLSSDTSVTFNIAPGVATQLFFTTPPSNTVAGAIMSPVVVTARDNLGNTATGFTGNITLAIGTNAGGGTLAGSTSVPAASGVATFSNVSIDKIGNGYTLAASATGPTSATSGTFNITPGAAARLAFGQEPVSTTGGTTIAPAVTVRVLDSNGNLTSSTASVSLGLTTGTGTDGAHLGGTVSKAASAGIATFSDLRIDSAGTAYTLNTASSGLTGDTSSAFNIAVGAATTVAFLVQPSNAPPNVTISPAVQVEIRDAGGNRVTIDNSTNVTVAIGTNPGGTLSGTLMHMAVAGVATFPDLMINNAHTGYTLTATAGSLTGATSNSFDIIVGTATKLAFFQQPSSSTGGATISPSVQVEIQDAGGNRVTTATNGVTLALGTNPNNGHLSGTKTAAAVNGLATFSDLSIDSATTGYALSATASGLSTATSSGFNITVGPAAKLGFRIPPSNSTGGVAISPAVQVEVQDAGGNRVTSATNIVSVSISTNPKAGTLSGSTALSAASGVATFSNLSIDSGGTGYRLAAAATGLTGATSPTFNITVGPATELGYSVQPTDVIAGVSIAPAVKVELRDAGGNRVTTASNTVAIAIGANPGGGSLSGTTSLAASSGVAAFSNLSINKSGTGYTLAATASGLTGATSSGFTVSADGVDAGLSTLARSADTVGQCTTSCSSTFQTSMVTVTVKDQFGNRIAGSPVVVSANGTGNVFSPSGSGTTDVNGTFITTYNASVVENKTLSATAGGIGLSQSPGIAVMPVLVGAGDIADCNSIKDDATANQLDTIPGTVFADGDNAYANGTTTNFAACYDPTWGRHKARTTPVVGNHEYDSSGTAAPYFTYFGAATADPLGNGFGYYSYDLGAWHIVVLNSDSGVTSPSSSQLTWLQNDLVGRTNQCVLALWHRPVFTSGSSNGASTKVRRLWQALENAGAEVVVNGHDHLYERFAPQDSLGNATSAGIREFIVGTGGGESHTNYVNSPANVEASDAANFSRGVLRLTLYPNSYRWDFLPAQGFPQAGTYTDSGSGTCH